MGIYLLTVGLALFLSWIIKSNKERKAHWLFNGILLIVLIFGLSFLIGFRYDVGTDWWEYKRMFEVYKDYSWGDILSLKEPGIRAIVKIVAYFTDEFSYYMFVCALICTTIPIMVMYRNSKNFLFSMTIYMLLNFLSQCNGMRQLLAMSMVFAGYTCIQRKQLIRFLICVLIGFQFHTSALFCIPIYFIYTSKPSGITTLIILFGTLLMRFGYDTLGSALGFFQDDILTSSSYHNQSVNFLRIIAMVAPLIIVAPLKGKMIQDKALAVNMLLANACVYLCMSGSAYFARLGLFTDMFLCMAIPSVFEKYGERDKGLIVFITIVCYAAFFYVSTTTTSNLIPYQNVFWM